MTQTKKKAMAVANIIGACAGLTLSSCATTSVTSAAGAPMESRNLAGTWTLSTVNGNSPRGAAFTMKFSAQGGVTGTVKCNSFSGQYIIRPEGIRFGDVIATLLGCEGFDPLVDQASEIVFSADSLGKLSRDNRKLIFRAQTGSASFIRGSE